MQKCSTGADYRLLSHERLTLSTRDPLLSRLSRDWSVPRRICWGMVIPGFTSTGTWSYVVLTQQGKQGALGCTAKLTKFSVRFVFDKKPQRCLWIRAWLCPNLNLMFVFFFSSVFDFTVSCSVAWMYDDTFYIPSFLKVLKASCGLRRTDRRISVSVLSAGWLCIRRTLCPAPRKYFSDACSQR